MPGPGDRPLGAAGFKERNPAASLGRLPRNRAGAPLEAQLRVIEGGNSRDLRQPLDEASQWGQRNVAIA